MVCNATWKSAFYHSKEVCSIEILPKGNVIQSVITGKYNRVDYTVSYTIQTSTDWKVVGFNLQYSLGEKNHTIHALHQPKGWLINQQLHKEFQNCIDIDITLTPFTNTLPINRLKLPLNKSQQIEVLYVDVLNNDIRVAKQQYTKKSLTEYNFQNVPNDFEADIAVDKEGFVVHYPELFERIEA